MNNELQYYTDRNAKVNNGVLTLAIKRENINDKKYTSSRLISNRNFTYGSFEMKAKLLKGNETVVDFSLISNECKLNILKYIGSDSGTVHAVVTNYGNILKNNSILINDPFKSFHIFKLNWYPKLLVFYVDEKEFFSYNIDDNLNNCSFKSPMNIVLNSEVQEYSNIFENSSIQVKFIVDFVRYYEI